MKKITFICNKLARDKTIENMHQEGMNTQYKLLTNGELLPALHNKLLEEALEVTQAANRTEVVAELADVFEVIDAIKHFYAITHEEIMAAKQTAYQARGGFQQGLFLESIAMDSTHRKVKYFRKSPDRYPEK